MSEFAVQTSELVKTYGGKSGALVHALNGLTLHVRSGEIFGLLGRNGAGKTTLLRILTTLIKPTGGEACVLGLDVQKQGLEVRRNICAVLQENALEVFLSVKDNLTTYARFHSVPPGEREKRALLAMEQFGLAEHSRKKVMDLSGGLKRRLQVAKVFMVDKPIVFLDEATTGMDPVNKRAVLEAIRQQAKQGRTILLTTHILQEAEELCDTIAMINRGVIIRTGDVNSIKSLATNVFELVITFEFLSDEILRRLSELPSTRFDRKGNTVGLCVKDVESNLLKTITELSHLSKILHQEVSGGTLEDAFIELLGRSEEGRA